MFRTIVTRVLWWKKLDDDALKLRALDDYLLADMGIPRNKISDFVRGRVRR